MIVRATREENEIINKMLVNIPKTLKIRVTKIYKNTIEFESEMQRSYKLHQTNKTNSKILKIDITIKTWQKIPKFYGMSHYFKDLTFLYDIEGQWQSELY